MKSIRIVFTNEHGAIEIHEITRSPTKAWLSALAMSILSFFKE